MLGFRFSRLTLVAVGEQTGGRGKAAEVEARRADKEAFAMVSSAGSGGSGPDLGGSGG